jgi:RND family efflux transporter MFP subunit
MLATLSKTRWVVVIGAITIAVRCHAQQPIAVSIAQPIQTQTADFDFSGVLEPARQADVRAGVDGKVLQFGVNDGDEVVEGQLIVELDHDALQKQIDAAYGEISKLKAELKELDARTTDALKKSGKEKPQEGELAQITAARDLVAANLEVKEADLQRLRGDLEATKITAPMAGRISDFNLQRDDVVHSGPAAATKICKITQTDPVRACFNVDLTTLNELRNMQRDEKKPAKQDPTSTQPLKGQFLMAVGSEEEFKYQGELDYLGSRADSRTGQVRVCAVFPNPDKTLDKVALGKKDEDRAVKIRFGLQLPRTVLLVTSLAVGQDRDGRNFVLAVNDKNQIEVCPVTLGPQHSGMQVIDGGLRADQWIVIGTPAAKLDSATTHSPIDFSDLRFGNLKSGATVVAVRTSMPRPGKTLREKTREEIQQNKNTQNAK